MEDKIWEFVTKNFLRGQAGQVRDDFKFDSDSLDSLRYVKLLLFLEEEFKIELPIETMRREDFNTIKKIVDIVRERQGKNP